MKNFLPRSTTPFVRLALAFFIFGSVALFAQTATPVTVAVAPGAVSVAGGGTQQFAATVLNTANTSVTWAVNGVVGGNATIGTISAAGLYSAPAVIPSTAIRLITARSQADPTKFANATLTALAVTISVDPPAATLIDGQTQQLTALVANLPSGASTAITWAVNGIVGGSTATGTITPQGLYTAPAAIVPSITAVLVTAVPQGEPTKQARVTVTLKGIVAGIAPAAVSLNGGATQQFAPTFTNAPSQAAAWYVNGIAGGNAAVGTVSPTGLYTAPAVIAKQALAYVKVASQVDPGKAAVATVTLLPPVTVTVTPGVASVVQGGTQQFLAAVANTSNLAVTWAVNGIAGGNAALGSISTTGLYTAPAVIPATIVRVITATSVADKTKSSSANLTCQALTVGVTPGTASIIGGGTQQFSATVTNATNTNVTWAVNGLAGGNATIGTISPSGLYTAPAVVPATVVRYISATSQADKTKAASASLTALAVTITVTPAAATLIDGQTQQLTATLANLPGTASTAVTWAVNGVVGGSAATGTITPQGLYAAPAVIVPSITSVLVTAVPQGEPTKQARVIVTLKGIVIAVAPNAVSLTAGATQQFTPTFTNAPSQAATWYVNGIAGGNAAVGTVSPTGLYTAPAVLTKPAVVTVKVLSQVDTGKAAVAAVTLVPPVTVTVTPALASLAGGATQQLTAVVANTANTAVTWAVNSIAGGNATVGTVSATGLYTAPAVVPTQTTVTVAATSVADPTKSSSSVLTLLPVSLTVTPTAASIGGGATQQFSAAVLNTTNKAVAWQVNGVTGGSVSTGTISLAGLYTAPAAVAVQTVVTIKAISQADTTKSASAQLTIAPLSITLTPPSVTLGGGATQQFTATVLNATNQAVTWQVSGITGGSATTGTISATGLYTAPVAVAAQTMVTVSAISQANAAKFATAQVTLSPVTITLTPASVSLATGATQQFVATVSNTTNKAVVWKVNGVVGGNATLGTISTAGFYSAPASLAAATTVTVAAVSQANTAKSATALVTLTPSVVKPVTITITPLTAALNTGASQQFVAVVLNTANTAVVWKVNGVVGGNATLGTISTLGLYAAPASLAAKTTVTVAAVSQADTTKSATAQVTVTPVSSGPVAGAFYVASTGNDSNAGTLASPWKTISHAASASSGVGPGNTVYVRGGTYPESVTIGVSGTATGQIVFQNYPGEKPVLDGTTLTPPSDQHGMFTLESRSYVTVSGFEVRNYKTSSSTAIPAGIWISGSGTGVKILNNLVHDIQTSSEAQGNAFGIAAYGTDAPASIDQITIDGNEVYNLRTGGSESVNVDGNVTNFAITNNIVHDNDNIAIDVIGNEGVSSNPTYDHARNGVISDNIVYNISGKTNPGEGNDYDADGIYVDGGTQIVIERNLIHHVDIGIEAASEHQGTTSSYITIRNNVVYASNINGISIGGYDSARGGVDHCTIVNNTLYGNDTQNSGSGEFQVQYYATNNVFKNNVIYATSQGLFINNYTNSEANPVDVDYNLYYSASGASEFLWNGSDYSSYASYQSATGKDAHSSFANPFFINLNLSGLNLDVLLTSPAINKGTNLGVTAEGTLDFAGTARVKGVIDIGAFEH